MIMLHSRQLRHLLRFATAILATSFLRLGRQREDYSRVAIPKPLEVIKTILDLVVTAIFIIATAVVLLLSINESPSTPVRSWITIYALLCIFHILCVYIRHRRPPWPGFLGNAETTRHLESMSNKFYVLWYAIGMLWLANPNGSDWDNAPQLTRLFTLFLFFDMALVIATAVVFFLFVVAVVSFCLPFAYAFSYYWRRHAHHQERRIEEEIRIPPCPFCQSFVPKFEMPIVPL